MITGIEALISTLVAKKGLWYGLVAFFTHFLVDIKHGKANPFILFLHFLVTVGTCIIVHEALVELEDMSEIIRFLWTFSSGVLIVSVTSLVRTAIHNPVLRLYLFKAFLGYKGVELKELDELIKRSEDKAQKDERTK